MKLTKTKLREMVRQELNEISGTRGGSANIERLRKIAANMKTKLAAKGTGEKVKGAKKVAKKGADSAYTQSVSAYDTKAADYTKQAAAAATKASAYATKLSTYNTKASERGTALSTKNTAKTAKTAADSAYTTIVGQEPKTTPRGQGEYEVAPGQKLGSAAYTTTDGRTTLYGTDTAKKPPRGFSKWKAFGKHADWNTVRTAKLNTKNASTADYNTKLADFTTKDSALGGYETLKRDALTAKQAADTLKTQALSARTAADTLKKSRKTTKDTAATEFETSQADYESALKAMSDAEIADKAAKAQTSFAFGAGGAGGAGGFGSGKAAGTGKGKGKGKGKKGGKKKSDESLHRILGRDLINEIDEIKSSIKIQRKVKK